MMTLNEKFTDVFKSMEEDKEKWMEFQKKCDDLKDAYIKCASIKIEIIIAEFVRDLKGVKDEAKVKKELDALFENSEIDYEFKVWIAVRLQTDIDNLKIKIN